MNYPQRRLFIVLPCLFLGLAGALAASLRLRFPAPAKDRSTSLKLANQNSNAMQQRSDVAPASIGPIDRNVIAGGGGTSTGGNFKVDGTIGQPAVGTTMSNGQFSVTGGFWQPESGA